MSRKAAQICSFMTDVILGCGEPNILEADVSLAAPEVL